MQVKGPHYYEETAHVPLILSAPGRLPAGARVSEIVELVDILPTFCELAGLAPPARAVGQSLLPLIAGETAGRGSAFAEQQIDLAHFVALRTPQYAYWRYLDHGDTMLFDMTADPEQRHNLMRSGPPADVVAECEREIAARRALAN
jgi:choline-sulfatase